MSRSHSNGAASALEVVPSVEKEIILVKLLSRNYAVLIALLGFLVSGVGASCGFCSLRVL